MKNITVIYDDTVKPDREIRSVTGDKSYGETIFKRITLAERTATVLKKEKAVKRIIVLKNKDDLYDLSENLVSARTDAIVYLYSNFAIANEKEFLTILKKACFVNEEYTAFCDKKPALDIFPDADSCLKNISLLTDREYSALKIDNNAFSDLSLRNNFLNFITGGFDARFFNALEGDEYTVTKRSNKKEKIKAEYEFYKLLPDDMKQWFVEPFDYNEDENGASYTMERYHMTDVAIRFVHGAVDDDELGDILRKLFYFISKRASRNVKAEEGKRLADELYLTKLDKRMEELKKDGAYEKYDLLLKTGTKYNGMEEVIGLYKELYKKLSGRREYTTLSIGHGDLCFSNILYSSEASLLRLIDPKGALNEDELYTDPYYDVCKLSHSVCGSYDFFNSGLFEVSYDRDLRLNLKIDSDEEEKIKIFRSCLSENGYDYDLVRVYEAGLFLSMMPFHMDQPGKVLGFLLNAIRIMEEVKESGI